MHFPDVKTLLEQEDDSAANATVTGDVILLTAPDYSIDPREVNAIAVFDLTQVGAGALNARIEGSHDNETWFTLAAMTALAAAGTQEQQVAFTSDWIPQYMRGKAVASGGAAIDAGATIKVAFTRAMNADAVAA